VHAALGIRPVSLIFVPFGSGTIRVVKVLLEKNNGVRNVYLKALRVVR